MNLYLQRTSGIVGEATEFLVGNGSTRDRLLRASKVLSAINPRELEAFPDIAAKWELIDNQLSSEKESRDGAYRMSVLKMSARKMGRVCAMILDLDRVLRATD